MFAQHLVCRWFAVEPKQRSTEHEGVNGQSFAIQLGQNERHVFGILAGPHVSFRKFLTSWVTATVSIMSVGHVQYLRSLPQHGSRLDLLSLLVSRLREAEQHPRLRGSRLAFF